MTLINTLPDSFAISLKIENLNEYLSLSDDFFELESGESKGVRLNFVGKKVGAFIGEVVVTLTKIEELVRTVEDVKISVPIILEVISKVVLFDVQLDIPSEYSVVSPGDELRAQITMFNIGAPENAKVLASYFIKDLRGNIVYDEAETLTVEKQISFVKSLKVPDDAKEGTYVAIVEATFAGSFAVSSQFFEVSEKEIVIKQLITRNIAILLFLILILIVILIYLVYKFAPARRKRK